MDSKKPLSTNDYRLSTTKVIIYQEEGQAVEVRLDANRNTVWLSQRQMAELLDISSDNIGLHLKNIYAEGELEASATTEDSLVVRQEGTRQVRRRVKHYNLYPADHEYARRKGFR